MQCEWQAEWEPLIEVLRREVKPALGCTEPIAVALAAAHCRRLLGQVPSHLQVWVSGNLFKNGMGVGVPGTGMSGLPIAAAIGAVAGDAEAGLEVLRAITADDVARAQALLPATRIDVKSVAEVLYVEVLGEFDGHQARVIICTDHTRVVLMARRRGVAHAKPGAGCPGFEAGGHVAADHLAICQSGAALRHCLHSGGRLVEPGAGR